MNKRDRQGSRTPAALEMKHRKVLSNTDDTTISQNAQITQLKQTVTQNESDTHSAIAALKVRVNNLEISVGALDGSDTTLADRMTVVEATNATQDEKIGGLTERVSALEIAVSGFAERLTTAEATLSSLAERVTALEG